MTTGFMQIGGIYIHCPECEEAVETDEGSQLVGIGDYGQLPKTIECASCGEKFRKPTWPTQRAKKATRNA